MLTWTPPTTNPEQAARDIVSAAGFLHNTFKDEVWLWRGQANRQHGLVPGMHSRVLAAPKSQFSRDESTVKLATSRLLESARAADLDVKESTRLPDLALLAQLQHHGAATPLLDVSTDPLIALWMIAFADSENPARLDDVSGSLFGIIKPPAERWISPLDSRKYASTKPGAPSLSDQLEDCVWWYRAPDITERLRIQRGSFIVGTLQDAANHRDTSFALDVGDGDEEWLGKRLEKRGRSSNTARRKTDAFAIIVRGAVKKYLRKLLEERSGLTIASVYPTPWHRPFIDEFSRAHGRARPLSFDLS